MASRGLLLALVVLVLWLAPAPPPAAPPQAGDPAGLPAAGRGPQIQVGPVYFKVWPPDARVYMRDSSGWEYIPNPAFVSLPRGSTSQPQQFEAVAAGYAPATTDVKVWDNSHVSLTLEPSSFRVACRAEVCQHPAETGAAVLVLGSLAGVSTARARVEAHRRRRETALARLASRDVQIGSLVGPYRLQAHLGEGGMAVVYRACRDEALGTSQKEAVALKLLHLDLCRDSTFRLRFQREVRISAALNHPHLVRTLDFGEDGGMLYLVMELVEGRTLREVAGGQALPWSTVAAYLRPLCEAVSYAHEQGVVHRDLKPDNVMIDQQGRLVVMDFGLAKGDENPKQRLTRTGVTMGTPAYMAPEQAQGPGLPASDQYALGCMAYELLSGQVPFDDPVPINILFKHLQEDALPLGQLRPDLPPAVVDAVMRMLAKPIDDRFPTVADALAALTGA